MSTKLPMENVNEMLQNTLKQQEQSLETSKMLYKKMVEVEGRMDRQVEKVERLHKQINDENRLLPAEIDELTTMVKDRAVSLTQRYYPELDGKEFRDEVGKMKRRIWSKLKAKFQTSKYIHTKRKDFVAAKKFIHTFDPLQYV